MAATLRSSSTPTLLSPRPRHHYMSRSPSPPPDHGDTASTHGRVGEEEDGRGRLRPRRTHVASTLSSSVSPAPAPNHGRHPGKTRRRLPSPGVDLYDTLVALLFAFCVVLFFRALSGSGDVTSFGRQACHAYAPTREDLHERAGTFCTVPLDSSGNAIPTLHKHKPHRYTDVPPDPHAHVSVDPDGSWSYALDHHLHAHEHDERHAWKALRERMLGLLGYGTDYDEVVNDDEERRRKEEEKDDADVVYPMRVHLPPSLEDDSALQGALQKHRKARGRSKL